MLLWAQIQANTKRGKFCPHRTFFFPPTPSLSLFLCSSVTHKSFGSTPGVAPALNIVGLPGSLRLRMVSQTQRKVGTMHMYAWKWANLGRRKWRKPKSSENMMSNRWIYGNLVVREHQRVTRLCLCSFMWQEHVATATKQSSDIVHVYTQLCHDKNRIYREREKEKELISWEFDIAVHDQYWEPIMQK